MTREQYRIRKASLNTSTRAITLEERSALMSQLGEPSVRRGAISHLAYYGAYVVLIPFMGGGFAARLLNMMGMRDATAFPVGFALGILLSTVAFRIHRRTDRRARDSWLHMQDHYRTLDHLEVITASPRRAWPLSSATDWPAYLFEDADGSFLLLAAEEIALPADNAVRDHLTITLIPPDEDIMTVTWAGGMVRLEPQSLPFFREDDWPADGQATILRRDALPRKWLEVINAV
jgi:hypothetical protein